MTTSRRGFALAATFALIVGACGGSAPSQSAATSGSAAPAGSTGASGAPSAAASGATGAVGDFTFVVDSEPTTLATEPDDLPTSWITGELYNSLYQPNYKLEYVPWVADGMPDISADGLTWTVKLKSGIKFHDGTELTADDVKFTYDLHLSKNCRGNPDVCSSWADNVKSVDVVDPNTIKITLKQKFAPFLSSGLGSTLIVPKKAVEESFGRFQQAAGAVSAADAKTLDDKVAGATAAQDANGKDTPCADAKTAPDTCKYSTYTKEMEDLLTKAGITLTNKAQYNTGGESGTDFDPEAYGQGLYSQVHDLALSLGGTNQIDQIAQSIKIIDFGQKPIGSGPFKFVKYSAGQNVEMARWENYFGGSTNIDPQKIPAKAFAVVIRDSAAATAALGNDEIQWQQKIESDAYNTVKDNQNVQIAEYPDNGYYYIGFNLRPGHIYSDKNLRTAFGMCIDHDKTVDVATAGNGVPVYANTPPFSWAFSPDVPKYNLDVAGAKQLIESSGWKLGDDGIYAKDGKKLSSTLYVRVGRPQRLSFAQLAADQLKECGIEVKPQEGDLNTVLIPKVLDYPNDFDTYLGGWSTALDPDDYSIFHSSEIPTKANPSANNFPGWKNPQADQLLEQGRTELDQNKRKDIYAQFQKLIHDDAPYYFLWADKAHTGLSKRVVSQNQPFDLKSVGINYYNVDAWTVAAKQ